MDTRKTAKAATATAAAKAAAANALYDPMALWSTLMDLPRQQSAAATHAACALISGFGAMQKIQEKVAKDALKHYNDAAQRLHGQCAPIDVLSVQMDLARYDAEAAAACWQQLATTALQVQAQVAACGCELVDSDKLLEACALFDRH